MRGQGNLTETDGSPETLCFSDFLLTRILPVLKNKNVFKTGKIRVSVKAQGVSLGYVGRIKT